MERERKPTRLELHRARFHKEGKKGPMLQLSSLDDEESHMLIEDFFKRMKVDRVESPLSDEYYRMYAEVLSDWGIMCPHPMDKRLYDGSKFFVDNENFRWFDCTMCRCAVMNPAWKGDPTPFKLPKPRPAIPVVRNTPGKGGDGAA